MNKPASQSKAFSTKVNQALDSYSILHREAIERGAVAPRLSISAFTKRYELSRSVLYESHKSLVEVITERFETLADEAQSKRRIGKRPSVSSLQAELIKTRQKAKRDLTIAHSSKMQDFLNEFGPAFRDISYFSAEKEQLLKSIEDLKKQVENQRNIIKSLMAQINN